MTEVSTTLRTAYLAGPMRGREEYNFPAFREAAKWLRKKGWTIKSPHERDEAEGFDPKNDEAHSLDYYMQFDLAMVSRSDAVICLPEWEDSQGARLEAAVAVELGHPVFEITDIAGTFLPRYKNGQYDFRTAVLTSVSPDYVKVTFADKSLHVIEFLTDEEVAAQAGQEVLLSTSADRKGIPLGTGVLDYFPAALVEVAKVSKVGNDKHNPGQPLHHARGKSSDHADALARHFLDRGLVDAETGVRHSAELAWRALALLQQELEDEGLAPLARGARLG